MATSSSSRHGSPTVPTATPVIARRRQVALIVVRSCAVSLLALMTACVWSPPADPIVAALAADRDMVRDRHLMVPVAGIEPGHVENSFDEKREGGRIHRAADIFAPRGTPVLATDDGRVLRVGSNTLGGLYVYTSDPSGRLVYYYAHLDQQESGLVAGDVVRRGQRLGTVGNTGNAATTPSHLHFQIMRSTTGRPMWDGVPINPAGLFAERGTLPRRRWFFGLF